MYEYLFEEVEALGVGTGRTVKSVFIGLDKEEMFFEDMTVFASSIDTQNFLHSQNIITCDISNVDSLDLYIDGLDRYNNEEIIKGYGGAILIERLFIQMSKKTVIFTQKEKFRTTFENEKVPIEIIPHALSYVERLLKEKNISYTVRDSNHKKGPLITEQGNCIIDIIYNKEFLKECERITGIIDTGLINLSEYPIEIIEI